MKNQFRTVPKLRIMLVALVCSAGVALAQDQYNTNNTFGTSTSITGWDAWYGGATESISWDGAMDAAGNPASGSMEIQVTGDGAQQAFRGTFSGTADNGGYTDYSTFLNGIDYSYLDMDIYVAASSPSSGGNYGTLQLGFYTGGEGPSQYSGLVVTNYVPVTAGGWVHIHAPINPTLEGLGYITGVWIQDDQPNASGTTTFYVDNIVMEPVGAPPPPPSISLQKAVPGLNLFNSAVNAPYQQQGVGTVGTGYSWVGATYPVSYSLTFTNYPGPTNYPGFQGQIIWISGTLPGYDYSPQYSAANALFLQIQSYVNNTTGAQLMWKTNDANDSGEYDNVIATLGSATPVGTWTVTFTDSADGNVIAPDGTTKAFSMPAGAAAQFAGPVTVYLGVGENNNTNNFGQEAIVSSFQITGTATSLSDTFTGPQLDPTKWNVVAEDGSGVVQVPATTGYWLWWTLPASGYAVQASTGLGTGASWAGDNLTNLLQINGRGGAVLVPTGVPGTGNGFFRLVQ